MNDAVQFDRRIVDVRTRSSQAWSSFVLRAEFALSNGKPWNVHMPSSACDAAQASTVNAAAAAEIHRVMSFLRCICSRPGGGLWRALSPHSAAATIGLAPEEGRFGAN